LEMIDCCGRRATGEHQRARPVMCMDRSLIRADLVCFHIWVEFESVRPQPVCLLGYISVFARTRLDYWLV
jgi:hypothetical protein